MSNATTLLQGVTEDHNSYNQNTASQTAGARAFPRKAARDVTLCGSASIVSWLRFCLPISSVGLSKQQRSGTGADLRPRPMFQRRSRPRRASCAGSGGSVSSFTCLACRLHRHPSRPRAGRRRAAWRNRRRRAGTGGRLSYPPRRHDRIFRLAGGHARDLCRRRRVGSCRAAAGGSADGGWALR